MTKISMSNIQRDTSIQCRATIDIGVINDYVERMTEGDVFPPVILFGSVDKCWIGDGWHRIEAAQSIGYNEIDAELKPGGREEALEYALSANAVHGHRRRSGKAQETTLWKKSHNVKRRDPAIRRRRQLATCQAGRLRKCAG